MFLLNPVRGNKLLLSTGQEKVALTNRTRQDRLRIVIYQPRMFPGGAQRVTLTLLNHLDRKRFAPILVLRKKDGDWVDRVPVDVPVYSLDRRVRSAWFGFGQLLRKIRPDVVLSMSTMGNLTACLGHSFSRIETPLIVTEHNTVSAWDLSRARLAWISFLKRVLYQRAKHVIAVSQGVAEDLKRLARIPDYKLSVIYNPVVDEELYTKSERAVDHPWFGNGLRPVILAAARLAPQKDFPMLLESFKRLRSECPARLMILGDGELRGQLENLTGELGIADDVAFLGFVDNAAAYMKRCTIFVLSSKYEGLPVGLLEAMACGAPVISTDCPSGPSEIISNGEDGLLVPVGDPAAMSAAMKLLLDDPELRNTIRQKGQERAARFSVENAMHQYETLLTTLANPSREGKVAIS